MRVVDDAVLSAIRNAGITIHDGLVETSIDGKVVNYDLPYAVYYSSVGDDDNRRMTGRKRRRSVFFSITYVGLDRRQAKWAGEKIRDAIADRRISVPGYRTWLCDLQESQRVRRDDDAIRPDGSPLYYGVDNYALSIVLTTPTEEEPNDE